MTDVLYFLPPFLTALLCLISLVDLPMTVWTSEEARKSRSLYLKQRTICDESRKKALIVGVLQPSSQVAQRAFTYLCTTIWYSLLPVALQIIGRLDTKCSPGVNRPTVPLFLIYGLPSNWRHIAIEKANVIKQVFRSQKEGHIHLQVTSYDLLHKIWVLRLSVK